MAAAQVKLYTRIELDLYVGCAICDEDVTIDQAFMVTACCHVFHVDCGLTWCLNQMTDKKTCAICRAPLDLPKFERKFTNIHY